MTDMVQIPAAPVQPVEKPVFDMSNMSWRDAKDFNTAQALVNKAQQNRDPVAFEAQMLVVEAILAKVLVSVPRAWVVRNAPEAIDWSLPESINLVRGDRMNLMILAFQAAQSPEEASGN